jgi:hypothetical protein
MAKKSTGVYVVDKFNEPYELTEYNLFVQKECAKLQKKNIHIPGSGNTLVYIGELWQKKKAKEAAKAVKDQKAKEKALREDIVRESAQAKAPASAAAKKASTIQHASGNSDLISIALREMGQPEWIQWETFQQREKRYNNLIITRDAEKAAQAKARIDAEKAAAAAKARIDAEKAAAAKARIDAEKAAQAVKEEIEKQRRYKIIENSRKIISTFNDNNAAYLSKSPSSKIFNGVQV